MIFAVIEWMVSEASIRIRLLHAGTTCASMAAAIAARAVAQ